MSYKQKKLIPNALFAAFCSLFLITACNPGERNETNYENKIEAAENEIGDPVIQRNEYLRNEGSADDTTRHQPARIEGQEGHPSPHIQDGSDNQNQRNQQSPANNTRNNTGGN